MLFNSSPFAVFLLLVLFLYRLAPDRARNPLLLVASLAFYTFWYPPYTLLLAVELIVNYALLRGMVAAGRRRAWLLASIGFTLGLLAFFKYAAFLVENALPLLEVASVWHPTVPEIFLPLGISFYSFQIIALAVDVYREEIEAPRGLGRYALFISFFPQLIAGPIVRGHQLLPQLERGGETSPERTRRGIWLLASGLLKKVLLADFLLVQFVDSVFSAPNVADGPYVLIGTYSFAFQVYFDFSGYTDMARGIGLLLGYELPLNFTEPYLSRNPAEYWRRWHCTLSRWLRDYLYIPLGGNRAGRARILANLLITMVLGGLWHGPAWTYVAWGTLHGLLLIGHRVLTRGRGRAREDAPLRLADAPRIVLLFNAVCLFYIFFRAPDLDTALTLVSRLFTTGWAWSSWPLMQTAVIALCASLHLLERRLREGLPALHAALRTSRWGVLAEGVGLGAVAGLVLAAAGVSAEFIYFQF